MKDEFRDNVIREKSIIVFDLEGYTKTDEKKARIWQYSFQRLGVDEEPISVSCGSELPPEMLEPLFRFFKDAQLIVGHNIEQHDRKVLQDIIGLSNGDKKPPKVPKEIIPDDKIWDTMKIEFLINSDIKRKSFALNTSHHAKDDVNTICNLFFNQLLRIRLLDEANNYLEALSENARDLIETIMDSPSPGSQLSESESLFEEMDSPISEYLYKDGTNDEVLELNAPIVLIAPIKLWGTIAAISRARCKRVLFNPESPDDSHLSQCISNTTSYGLDKWFDCVKKQYIDNTRYEYIVELPEYLQVYIKDNIVLKKSSLSFNEGIICVCPKEDGSYSNEIKELISQTNVVFIGPKSSSVFKSVSKLTKYIRNLLPGSNQLAIDIPEYKSVDLSAIDKSRTKEILNMWRNRKGDFFHFLSQMYPDYIPVIVTQSWNGEKELFKEISKVCNRDYCGYYKIKVARRLQIATKNQGITSMTMDEFLFLNKRINGQFILIFDNFDIENPELDYYKSIILITANRWFTTPKVLILDSMLIQKRHKVEVLDIQ